VNNCNGYVPSVTNCPGKVPDVSPPIRTELENGVMSGLATNRPELREQTIPSSVRALACCRPLTLGFRATFPNFGGGIRNQLSKTNCSFPNISLRFRTKATIARNYPRSISLQIDPLRLASCGWKPAPSGGDFYY
jgi:hypothetical protein